MDKSGHGRPAQRSVLVRDRSGDRRRDRVAGRCFHVGSRRRGRKCDHQIGGRRIARGPRTTPANTRTCQRCGDGSHARTRCLRCRPRPAGARKPHCAQPRHAGGSPSPHRGPLAAELPLQAADQLFFASPAQGTTSSDAAASGSLSIRPPARRSLAHGALFMSTALPGHRQPDCQRDDSLALDRGGRSAREVRHRC